MSVLPNLPVPEKAREVFGCAFGRRRCREPPTRACEEFFRRRNTFDRLLGASAGAITATLLGAGYTPAKMLDALGEKGLDGKSVFAGFMGRPHPQ